MSKDKILMEMAIEEEEKSDALIREAHHMADEGSSEDEAFERIVYTSRSHGATARMLLDLIEDVRGL